MFKGVNPMGVGGQSGQGAGGAREVDTVDTASTSRPALGSPEFCGFSGDFGVVGAAEEEKNRLPRQDVRVAHKHPTAGERGRVWRRGFRLGISGSASLADWAGVGKK